MRTLVFDFVYGVQLGARWIPIPQIRTLSQKNPTDIILMPLPLDTNFFASSGDKRMGGSGKRDGHMNGY